MSFVEETLEEMFQSPRSGKFVSNLSSLHTQVLLSSICFNPLDRGNLYQMHYNI